MRGRPMISATAPDAEERPEGTGGTLRRILLALVHVGTLGLLAELYLLDHTGSLTQWIPFLCLLPGLASAASVALEPSPIRLRVFRGLMVGFVAAGLLGLILHFKGNMEFELERNSSLGGLGLVWESLRGATPTLAPGALLQLGLVGLAYTFRHPRLRSAVK
ncbi:MAG: hypothetical protein KY464_12670 [Gemmatimonadetes bacterium]|nr:hypothetical protein [Gemmatimonadota bacterium]